MYTAQEYSEVNALFKRRLAVAAVPAAVVFLAAVGIFVYGQLNRNDSLWILTTVLTILAGGWFFFLYGVYARPMRMYRIHIGYMIGDRQRETTGIYKSFAEKPCEKNGVDCYAVMLNVGDRDEGEDDRLFYYDAHKEKPSVPFGTRVTVRSNDMMVSDFKLA